MHKPVHTMIIVGDKNSAQAQHHGPCYREPLGCYSGAGRYGRARRSGVERSVDGGVIWPSIAQLSHACRTSIGKEHTDCGMSRTLFNHPRLLLARGSPEHHVHHMRATVVVQHDMSIADHLTIHADAGDAAHHAARILQADMVDRLSIAIPHCVARPVGRNTGCDRQVIAGAAQSEQHLDP